MSGLALLAVLAAQPALSETKNKKKDTGSAWTYGEHPLWGLSAHVTAGEHSVGLRCLAPKDDGPVVAVAFTPGLVVAGEAPMINYKIAGTQGEGSYRVDNKGKYFEGAGTTCGISLDELQKGRTLVLEDIADKPKVLGRIPLTGAKAAIGKLIAACPAMKRDIANCGF